MQHPTPLSDGKRIVGAFTASEGAFVYKVADRWKTKEALDGDLLAFELLPQMGFRHIPMLLRTSQDRSHAEVEGRLIYLLEYVGDKSPAPTPETYSRLGELTAELHLVRGYRTARSFEPRPSLPTT